MPLVITFPLQQHMNTAHYGIPRGLAGRGGNGIEGICLHVLESPIETYMSYLRQPLLRAEVRPEQHGSVHYGIEADGTIHHFVLDTNTAWAVRGLDSATWGLLPDFVGIDMDYLFIHVGVERFLGTEPPPLAFRSLVQLLATLCVQHSIAVDADHIITHTELEASYATCDLVGSASLIAAVENFILVESTELLPNVTLLLQQVALLQAQVTNLQTDVDDTIEDLTPYATHATVVATSSVLGHVKSSTTMEVAVGGAASTKQLAASYKIASGTQLVVAAITAIVQFPTVLSDALAWVTLGGFWHVRPSVIGLYRLRARVQFASAAWSANKYIRLDVFREDVLLETIAYKYITGAIAAGILDIAGECTLLVATLTDDYDVRVTTDDANGSKTIASGSMSIEKVGA